MRRVSEPRSAGIRRPWLRGGASVCVWGGFGKLKCNI